MASDNGKTSLLVKELAQNAKEQPVLGSRSQTDAPVPLFNPGLLYQQQSNMSPITPETHEERVRREAMAVGQKFLDPVVQRLNFDCQPPRQEHSRGRPEGPKRLEQLTSSMRPSIGLTHDQASLGLSIGSMGKPQVGSTGHNHQPYQQPRAAACPSAPHMPAAQPDAVPPTMPKADTRERQREMIRNLPKPQLEPKKTRKE